MNSKNDKTQPDKSQSIAHHLSRREPNTAANAFSAPPVQRKDNNAEEPLLSEKPEVATFPVAQKRDAATPAAGAPVIQPVWQNANRWKTLGGLGGLAKTVEYGAAFRTNHLRANQDPHEDDMNAVVTRYAGKKAQYAGKNTMVLEADVTAALGALDFTDNAVITGDTTNGFYAYLALAHPGYDWRPLNPANAMTGGNVRLNHRLDYNNVEVWGYVSKDVNTGTGVVNSLSFKVTHLQSAW